MKIIKDAKPAEKTADFDIEKSVSDIISDIIERRDEAVRDYSIKFDGNNRINYKISREEIEEAYAEVGEDLKKAIKKSIRNVKRFANRQRITLKETGTVLVSQGVFLGHRLIPVDSVLCYVPGGNYPLFSTAIMLITPAKVAGVPRIVATTPISKETDKPNSATLVAMDMAGADEIYCIGGVQAIAAFAHGTESIESVSMIVGPGNSYVAEAKRQCYGKVGIDFVAGPSEVLIIADKYAEPSILAADLLAQCEHDKSARGILLTDSEEIALRTIEEVERQLNKLETADIARAAWEDNSFVYLTDDIWEAVAISNEIAPEHLELMVRNYKIYMRDLRNYGSLFLGKYSAEVFGDYSSGTNHTLPTSGAARYTGGVSVGNFLKTVTYQKITKKGYRKLARHTELMAENEGLQAHANAVRVRR